MTEIVSARFICLLSVFVCSCIFTYASSSHTNCKSFRHCNCKNLIDAILQQVKHINIHLEAIYTTELSH